MDADDPRPVIELRVGESAVLASPRIPTAMSITDPTVAVAVTLATANKIQVQGVRVGTTDVLLQFGPGVEPLLYDISVHRDVRAFERTLDGLVETRVPLEVGPAPLRVVADAVELRLAVGEALVLDPCADCRIDEGVSASVRDPSLATIGTAQDGTVAVVARAPGRTWVTLRYGRDVIATELVVVPAHR